jgi:hypothetical protein
MSTAGFTSAQSCRVLTRHSKNARPGTGRFFVHSVKVVSIKTKREIKIMEPLVEPSLVPASIWPVSRTFAKQAAVWLNPRGNARAAFVTQMFSEERQECFHPG